MIYFIISFIVFKLNIIYYDFIVSILLGLAITDFAGRLIYNIN